MRMIVVPLNRTFKQRRPMLYLLMIPGILFFIIYRYIPMFGVLIAFKEYSIAGGILQSPWVGLKYFNMMLSDEYFWRVFKNTLIISSYKLLFGAPVPIILALMLNEVRKTYFKRFIQSVSYIPHFLSWIVIGGIFLQFFYRSGFINTAILEPLFGQRIDFFGDSRFFRSILVLTDIWKTMGWNSIIYLAAITSINAEMYEASTIDGAGKFQQAFYITLPSIMNIVFIVLILDIGNILNAGFEQVFILYNPIVYNVGDIIDTFVYRVGLEQFNFSYSAAVGLFKGLIGMLMVLLTNRVAKSLGQEGIW